MRFLDGEQIEDGYSVHIPENVDTVSFYLLNDYALGWNTIILYIITQTIS